MDNRLSRVKSRVKVRTYILQHEEASGKVLEKIILYSFKFLLKN